MSAKLIKHASYGNMRLTRVHGTQRLFGSPVENKDCIRIEIVNSGYEVDDYGHQKTQALSGKGTHVVTLEMTELQFARAISSLGQHDGVDCTIIRREGARVEPDMHQKERALDSIMDKVKERMGAVSHTVEEAMLKAEGLLAEGKTTKKQLHEIHQALEMARRELSDKTPYIVSVAEECLREMADAVKHDVSSHVARQVAPENRLAGEGLSAPENLLARRTSPLYGDEEG